MKDKTDQNTKTQSDVIGVVTPTKKLFDIWVKETGKPTYGDKYKFVILRHLEDVIGMSFFTVENGIYYYEVDKDVYYAAILHINYNK
jgi:hypothetical protein